jgi:hypothetical protein
MATAKAAAIQRPLIQIDDEVREMTDKEFLEYEEIIRNISIGE